MTRRETHVPHEVVYAAVGATAAPDVMRFPPEGTTPFSDELRLGSGSERFLISSSLLMTWGAQRAAGIEVTEVAPGDGGQYAGVVFNADGTPEVAADADVQFGPDGTPYLAAGATVVFSWSDKREPRQFRVVYTLDEPRRVGFAVGTADDSGVIGEEAFLIEHREDDSVWATVRGFLWPPAGGLLGLKGRAEIRIVVKEAREQLAALAPGAAANAFGEDQATGADEAVTEGDESPERADKAAPTEAADPVDADVIDDGDPADTETRDR